MALFFVNFIPFFIDVTAMGPSSKSRKVFSKKEGTFPAFSVVRLLFKIIFRDDLLPVPGYIGIVFIKADSQEGTGNIPYIPVSAALKGHNRIVASLS